MSGPKDRRFICGPSCHYGEVSATRITARSARLDVALQRCYQHKVGD